MTSNPLATPRPCTPGSSPPRKFIVAESTLALEKIPPSENLYVTFDIDSLDPTLAPGAGTLEPGGLDFQEIGDLLKGIPAKGKLVGLDIVEINPYRDSSGRTAQTAIRLMVDLLAAAFH